MTAQLDFWEYIGTLLETLYKFKKKGIPLETCQFYARALIKPIIKQNPDLEIEYGLSRMLVDSQPSTNEILAADIHGNPILVNAPQHLFGRYTSLQHQEEKTIPCYLRTE